MLLAAIVNLQGGGFSIVADYGGEEVSLKKPFWKKEKNLVLRFQSVFVFLSFLHLKSAMHLSD